MDHHAYQHSHRHLHAKRESYLSGSPSSTTAMGSTRVLVPRSTCTNDSDEGCHKPSSVPTLPIVLAVVIPVFLAACVLFYFHRKSVKKLKQEDETDKYKSLDFGMDPNGGKKGGSEMSVADAEKSIRGGHIKGLSMDVGSPYILPAGLHSSRESFHSLSRSTTDPHDPYRPVTMIKGDGMSSRSASRAYRQDNGSMYTSSSSGDEKRGLHDGLLKNAQRMSQSYPVRGESLSPQERKMPEFPEPVASPLSPLNPRHENEQLPPPPPPPVAPLPKISEPAETKNEYVAFNPALASGPPAAASDSAIPDVRDTNAPGKTTPSPPPFPRVQSQEAVVNDANHASILSQSSYGDGFQVTPPSPGVPPPVTEEGVLAPAPLRPRDSSHNVGLGVDEFGQNTNRLSMSLRPLPPDDPNENPEERANRIRSFYKEYFDDSRPEVANAPNYNDYYEDYGSEYLDGTVFDPVTNQFVVAQPQAPFAQPVTRRAMTPPPRAPPRFRSNTGGGPRGPAHMSGSSQASSRFLPPPRGMSSMSGRLPAPQKKPLPPPTPLSALPTPAKLAEDSAIFNAADFAPPVSFRERQNGMRPDSPLGGARPYSPSLRPHTPLASSFDDLAAMPSPHLLRNSGTFTALDFAPPPKFRDPGSGGSDAGSIRSNRSGMSSSARMAVRSGANRVSRIPKEMVGTKDDITVSLRPKLDMVSPA